MSYPRVMILTGAGASATLGDQDKPLPMMPEWASSLINELGYAAQLLGLRENMPGDEFEAVLGKFVAFANALTAIAPLHDLGGKVNVLMTPQSVQHSLDSSVWFSTAESNVRRVQGAIHRNLFDLFNESRVDEDAAYESYGALHSQVRNAFDDRPVFLAHVTTNFDHAIEAAIALEADALREPRTVFDGFAQSYGGRNETWAPNLLRYATQHDGEIPVLHLHGAVGWYFSDDGTAIRRPSDELLDERLTPALLLPDDKKDVRLFPGPLREIWEQFRQLLSNSTHVLVLGHSLHDNHLVDELRVSGKPIAYVALTEPDEHGRYQLKKSPALEAVSKQLPKAKLIPGCFGQRSSIPDVDPAELKIWLRDHAPRD